MEFILSLDYSISRGNIGPKLSERSLCFYALAHCKARHGVRSPMCDGTELSPCPPSTMICQVSLSPRSCIHRGPMKRIR